MEMVHYTEKPRRCSYHRQGGAKEMEIPMQKQLYSTGSSKETWDGGYDHIGRWLDREAPTEEALRLRLWNHFDTPATERGPFWNGVLGVN